MSTRGQIHYIGNFAGITFTVDKAFPAVDLILDLVTPPFLSLDGSLDYFTHGENVYIESFILVYPYQFGQGNLESGPIQIELGWEDANANSGVITEIGTDGKLMIPDVNAEYNTGVMVYQPATATAKWKIGITGLRGSVNMINTPDSLDDTELKASFMLKVRHTLPMIG